jgi:hypothetical protein
MIMRRKYYICLNATYHEKITFYSLLGISRCFVQKHKIQYKFASFMTKLWLTANVTRTCATCVKKLASA